MTQFTFRIRSADDLPIATRLARKFLTRPDDGIRRDKPRNGMLWEIAGDEAAHWVAYGDEDHVRVTRYNPDGSVT